MAEIIFDTDSLTVTVRNHSAVTDVADEKDASLPFGCREGQCGTCRVMVIEGMECLNDIEDEEIIDFDLSREDIHDGPTEDVHKIKKDFFTNDGLFIIIYEEDEDIIDKLLVVHEVIEGDTRIHLKDENDNDEVLFFDMDDTLIMKNTSYSILEVEKVEIFSDDIDEVELLVTKDIYPEIDIEMEEMKDKIYSIQEKKESLLTELISVFKAYGNDVLIFQIVDIVNTLIKMYSLYDEIPIDNSDTLEFVKNIYYRQNWRGCRKSVVQAKK